MSIGTEKKNQFREEKKAKYKRTLNSCKKTLRFGTRSLSSELNCPCTHQLPPPSDSSFGVFFVYLSSKAELIERLENVTYNGYQMLIKTNNDNAFLMKIEIFFEKKLSIKWRQLKH